MLFEFKFGIVYVVAVVVVFYHIVVVVVAYNKHFEDLICKNVRRKHGWCPAPFSHRPRYDASSKKMPTHLQKANLSQSTSCEFLTRCFKSSVLQKNPRPFSSLVILFSLFLYYFYGSVNQDIL